MSETLKPITFSSVYSDNNDVDEPAANTDAVITYAAVRGACHVITGLAWSYDNVPTNGNLSIAVGGATIFSMDITTGGAGFIIFPAPKHGSKGKNMVVTLSAGGSGVTGKVNVLNHWVE